MRKEIAHIIRANYQVGDAEEAANDIVELLLKKVIMSDENQPRWWDNWTIERQEGYILALRYLKGAILK